MFIILLPVLAVVLVSGCDSGDGGKAVCGDGVLESGEACDLGQFGGATCESLGFDGGQLACSATCGLDTSGCSTCGNGVLEPGEACDGTLGNVQCSAAGFVLGVTGCRADCTRDTTDCQLPLFCGNGQVDPGEPCDPTAPGGGVSEEATCGSVSLLPGPVVCDANCRPDFIGCRVPTSTCGDGAVDGGEACEGNDLRGATCEDLFYFGGGTLRCYPGCTYDASACSPLQTGTTSASPCEVGLPCFPRHDDLPRRCVTRTGDPADADCELACERHDDCPLGLSCLEAGGLHYCGQETCDRPDGPCLLAGGLPGHCRGGLCQIAGARQSGQVCVLPEEVVALTHFPVFNWQYDPLWHCADAPCEPDGDPTTPHGLCGPPACDGPGVLAGTAPDSCPPLYNCAHTSEMLVSWDRLQYPVLLPAGGQCLPMVEGLTTWPPAKLACHVVTGRMTYRDVECPAGTGCVPQSNGLRRWPGSLQGSCVAVPTTPFAQGGACDEDARCGAGSACVPPDPLAEPFVEDGPRVCRRACDAAVYADNPACAGLPGDTTWVCLSISRFFTQDNGLTWTNPDDPEEVLPVTPSPLGFCVPESP